MARCNQCGAELPDYYTSCPNCGSNSLTQGAAAAQPQAGYSMPVQTREVTTAGQWFGWMVLMGVLPIIGAIIVINKSKDPTAQNYAKLMIILQAISIVLNFVTKSIYTPILEQIASQM